MRVRYWAVVLAGLCLTALGCNSKEYSGPTVDKFTGVVTSNGKPISIPPGTHFQIRLRHESGQSFGIPINTDGTFEIGWMPLGHYEILTESTKEGQRGGMGKARVPGPGLQVTAGKTEYTIDLGKNFKF